MSLNVTDRDTAAGPFNWQIGIADEFFATPPGGPPSKSLEVGDRVLVQDPVTGTRRSLTVAAVSTDDYLTSGAYMGIDGMREIFGTRAVPSRYFVGGNDIQDVVERFHAMLGAADGPAVALTGSSNRYFLRQITEATFPNLTVLSHSEIPPGIKVVAQGVIRMS